MIAHPLFRQRLARIAGIFLVAVSICLVGAFAPGRAGALPRISAGRFQSAFSCICHGEQQSDWALSMHAKALADPVYVLKKSQADKASGGVLGEFCDTCHTPIGTMAGQTTGGRRLSPQSREGVTCDFCHQVTGSTRPIGDASQRLRANGTKRAQFKDASSPSHETAYSQFHTTGEFCGACHELTHPTTGVKLDTTYSDWRAGPYASQGIVCQDCHMSVVPKGGPTSGRAAALGPIRSYIYLMTFAGANVPLGNSERAVQILKSAATVSIEAPDVVEQGATSDVRVTVSNVGAGHEIPAGVAEIRQMWLEVNAVASDGTKTLLGTRQFGTVFRDAKGRYPVQLWDAVAVQSNDRISPMGSVESTYTLKMAGTERVSIEAVLNYKSFPDDMAKQARVSNPVTEMARATKPVYSSMQQQRRAERRPVPWFVWAGVALLGAAIAVAGFLLVRRMRRRRRTAAADRARESVFGE